MKCKLCESDAIPFFSMKEMPLANGLLDRPDQKFARYDIELCYCPNCTLVQLAKTVPPEDLFSEYLYYTSANEPMVRQARNLADEVMTSFNDRNIDDRDFYLSKVLVSEIGSNDGYLLKNYAEMGIQVLGIDPARGPSNNAAFVKVPTVQDFFSLKLAKTLPKADIIHANNVLAHIPDMHDCVAGIAEMLKPDGRVIVEVPWVKPMMEKTAFDTIYHEHVYYFSQESLARLFARHGLFLRDTQELDCHGGSLRCRFGKGFAMPSERMVQISKQESMMSDEWYLGKIPPFYTEFSGRANLMREDFKKSLVKLKSQGLRIVGMGAAAKATVLLNACGITNDLIDYIGDSTPAKQGKLIPGTGIPIVSLEKWANNISANRSTVLFAWNYEKQIRQKYPFENFLIPWSLANESDRSEGRVEAGSLGIAENR